MGALDLVAGILHLRSDRRPSRWSRSGPFRRRASNRQYENRTLVRPSNWSKSRRRLSSARATPPQTHSLRRTKAAIIYKQTGNLRAVQILLGHRKIESTVRYLGVDVEDALLLAEGTEV